MATGYVKNGADYLELRRSNMRYWDAGTQTWKEPEQAYYYNGSSWVPFIRSVPPAKTILPGGGSGKVFYYERSPGQSSTYYAHLSDMIIEAGYDAEATKASGGDVTLRMQRAEGTGTTRNISFSVILRNSDDLYVASSDGMVGGGKPFTITLPKHKIGNGMYFRWTDFEGGNATINRGWEFYLDGSFTLEFPEWAI